MISQFIRPGTWLRPGPISVRRNRAFRPASVLGLDELESRVVLSVTLSVTAAPFYADPSGVNDSSAAIQNCINAVHADGGGTVSFPAGTYKISFAGAGQPTSGSMFTVPANITFAGASQTTTTIFMAPNQGNWNFLFNCHASTASNIVFQDLTFDQNGLNTGGTPSTIGNGNARQAIYFGSGTGNIVQRCRFTNIVSAWVITFQGQNLSATVQNCTFDNIGLNTHDFSQAWDCSIIYTEGTGVTITGNTFTGRLVNGTTVGAAGATTAIEIHGGYQTITNNTVSYMAVGVNVCTSSDDHYSDNQLYQYNTFNNVSIGFSLFPGPGGTLDPLTNASILDNTITVDVNAWFGFWGIPPAGIHEDPGELGPTSGLTISGNTITFIDYLTTNPPSPSDMNGIQIIAASQTNTGLTITNNNIVNPYAAGIYLNTAINGLTITGNVITDPGSGTNGLTSDDFSAVHLMNNMQNATVESNTFIDNRTTSEMAEGILEETDNLGNCVYGGDQLQITSGADRSPVCERIGPPGPGLAQRLCDTNTRQWVVLEWIRTGEHQRLEPRLDEMDNGHLAGPGVVQRRQQRLRQDWHRQWDQPGRQQQLE